jgi:hypothetical protein
LACLTQSEQRRAVLAARENLSAGRYARGVHAKPGELNIFEACARATHILISHTPCVAPQVRKQEFRDDFVAWLHRVT